MKIIEALNIPASCSVNQKIHKKLFYENIQMNSIQKKLFKEELEHLNWLYRIAPDTINIPAFIDEDYYYDEIAVIEAVLKSSKHALAIAEVVHKVPYPVVLILTHENSAMLSLAPKRINHADNTKRIIENHSYSNWIEPDHIEEYEKDFLRSLNFPTLSFKNLYKLYEAIINRIIALQSASITDSFAIASDSMLQRTLLEELAKLQTEANVLRNQLKKEDQFNEKVQLNVKLKTLEQQMIQKRRKLEDV